MQTPSTPPLPDAATCPLCGQVNHCAMEAQRVTGIQQPPCWCTQATFSTELLAHIPAPALGLTCVCAACAARDDEA